MSLPPFTRAVTWLIGINTALYLVYVASSFAGPWLYSFERQYFALTPIRVVQQGWVWQLASYGFLHFDFLHWFGNMLGLWMFGSAFEGAWGTRRFVELFSIGVVGAAITTVAFSYTHVLGDPLRPTIGASGGVFAILIAYGILFAESEIMMIPFPIAIKAKYFVGILIVVTLIFAMMGGGNVAYVAHLGGLLFGWLYVRRGPKPALLKVGGFSERYFGMRNAYYRWKRRRAAKKFEVYMREHDRDVHFDEHGNYIPPDDRRKGNGGGKSGWVN